MVEFAIATAAATALNLAIAYLTKPDQPKSNDDEVIAKSQYGFPLRKPYGKVRLNNCNIFWALPVRKETEDSGGKGGQRSEETVYYQNFAFEIGYEQIQNLDKIYFSKELVYNSTSDDENTSDEAERLEAENLEIYLGTLVQTPSPHLQRYEGIENVPAFRKVPYVVVKNYPSKTQSFPTVDVVVKEADNRNLAEINNDVCSKVGLDPATQIDNHPILVNNIVNGAILKQDGGSAQQFIEELQKAYFFFPRDLGNRLQFISLEALENEIPFEIPFNSLGGKEAGSDPIPPYEQIILDEKTLPSKLDFEFVNAQKDYDLGSQPAYDESAQHSNENSIRTSLVFSDTEGSNIAWKLLAQSLQQSRKFEKISILPLTGVSLFMGQLISIPVAGEATVMQITTKEVAENLLVELSAVIYDLTTPQRVIPTIYFPNNTIAGTPTGEVIALDIPLYLDTQEDFGIFLGVRKNSGNWTDGAIYFSDDNGATYTKLTNFNGTSTTGIITAIPLVHSPHTIDTGSEIIVQLDDNKSLEGISFDNFLSGKNLGLFGSEYIAWQNAELISPQTYKLTTLLRGLRGTEWAIDQHSLDEPFVLLRGTGARLTRIRGDSSDLGKTLLFKAVHSGDTLDSIGLSTSLTITGEGLKPYAPTNPRIIKDSVTGDLIIQWNLRSRKYGSLQNNVGITQVDINKTLIEILDTQGNIVKSGVSENSEYIYTAAAQLEDLGTNPNELSFNLAQASSFVGKGRVLNAINLPISGIL